MHALVFNGQTPTTSTLWNLDGGQLEIKFGKNKDWITNQCHDISRFTAGKHTQGLKINKLYWRFIEHRPTPIE